MSLLTVKQQQATRPYMAYALRCEKSLVMSLWSHQYQAETVDLRYFFHKGWSS
ncbi:hypothetical protein [Marinomonas mediterranea]|jgi:hypothetical protein|uniref:Uncharacterized protein n=1 Tax=Marinomonas mediterranea (strain ATCC 700492 / JCM 21426 / NBRC 103028 / MMB-1) TaxID=717774 RepID=F2JW29_MARM1|nr:hypothetical protein [Marinomonas mediterranea]ADZ92917.1 hypothetical protein Marme_3707 [Marinomonas mediterranea MMB-1]WCN18941.1 hypothetical protein GV053_18790 [Marinomonas mediterranea MMB-1]